MRLHRKEVVLAAHENSVWTLAWCPDQSLLSGSLDETVLLWMDDVASGAMVKKHCFLIQGLGSVSLAMHNGGHLAAASCLDGCVRVWDTQDASKTIQQLQAAASENWGIDFAPIKEKAILAIAGGMTSSLSLYAIQDSIENVQTFKFPKIRDPPQRNQRSTFVLSTKFAPDGKRIIGTCDNGFVMLFDVETGKDILTLTENTTPVRTAVFSPDGRTLVAGSDAAYLTMYDTNAGTVISSIDSRSVKDSGSYEDPSMFLDLSFHPSGSHFTSTTAHGKIYLWEVKSKERLQVIEEHADAVWCAQFSPDGTRLATACEDGSLGIFSVQMT